MNSMRRGDAVDRVEDYAFVIVEHLALCLFFSEHPARNHWEQELAAFAKPLHKANKARGGGKNFGKELVEMTLMACLDRQFNSENLSDLLDAKGMALPAEPDWEGLKTAIKEFSQQF